MKKITFAFTSCVLIALNLSAQNLHVTYRSKLNFPGQTLANVWGYSAGGREYALAGGSKGLIIVDVTNPDQPQQIVQITGPNNLWKEIKTYGHYAYIVSEGGQGIQIVDLSGLPSPNLDSHFYTGDGVVANGIQKVHALHIDTTKGFLYAYGGSGALYNGGARVFDLKPDPYNPKFVGKFDQLAYIHDGYVDNDTLYAGHIYQGIFSVVDMTDKSNPRLLATQNTPNNFTHNTWLSGDRRTLFTTDEVNNSTLAAFDISDLDNIRLLDKIQSNPGSNSMVHNTHILGNYAVTSWYKDGFTIVDVSRPDNLVQVGNYDVFPSASGGQSDGCWGVYPYFPSGTVVATVISAPNSGGELWVMTPEYVRACYLEGKITDGFTGHPLTGALVEVPGLSPANRATTLADGAYKMGQEQTGYFTVRVSKPGYLPQEFTVLFQRGELRILNAALYPAGALKVEGQVTNKSDGQPVSGALVTFSNFGGVWETGTDASGQFLIENLPPGIYDIAAGAAGYGQVTRFNYKIAKDLTLNFSLSTGYKTIQGDQPGSKSRPAAWPNPFRTSFEIVATGRITVLDQFGRNVATHDVPEGQEPLRLGAEWPAGVYFLRYEMPGERPVTEKLVKM
ncbi:MAG: choice-of-anchor B family protein [Thermoanaerobaculia bacterium]|nr:choice-of-anchor B family protein [Thermoanaerobaculia bacterium]